VSTAKRITCISAAAVTGLLLITVTGYAEPSTALWGSPADANTVHGAPSNGDLWPSCESDDGNLYAANGDGTGFDPDHEQNRDTEDIVVNRITGSPYRTPASSLTLSGQVVAIGGDPAHPAPGRTVGRIWTDGPYNRKPTGLLCTGHKLYLAVQDLRKETFSDAPAATILESSDHGRSWTWDPKPMFGGPDRPGHEFTTVFFLDYGRDGADSPDPDHVYAYGLDESWAMRKDLYLARIPRGSIRDRTTWQWSTGPGTWSAPGVLDRAAVLHDDRGHLSQGSVVYDKPLNRYLYTTWSESPGDPGNGQPGEATWEFSESATPWGPWRRFLETDFGPKCGPDNEPLWTAGRYGGYTPTVPAKYLSSDGRTMWVQSNVLFVAGQEPGQCASPDGAPRDFGSYAFSLRPVWLTTPDNLLRDPGYEGQSRYNLVGIPLPVGPAGAPWTTEGPDVKGTDLGTGLAHGGANSAWIHPADRSTRAWNAITQPVGSAGAPIQPHRRYVLKAHVQTSANLTAGYFGVRGGANQAVLAETGFGPLGSYTELTVTFDSGDNHDLTVFAGYWAPGADSWLRLDDVSLAPA
jgi:hypothetical protein